MRGNGRQHHKQVEDDWSAVPFVEDRTEEGMARIQAGIMSGAYQAIYVPPLRAQIARQNRFVGEVDSFGDVCRWITE